MDYTTAKYRILRDVFGFDSFKEGQEQLVDCTLRGRDCLGIMPTGAGKSLCFYVPAIALDGITLVISPLISLMKDQVNSLVQNGVKAAFLNSSLSLSQFNAVLNNAKQGHYKIIYIAPERLLTDSFFEFANQAKISMITIDEAHCISQWGNDFRPSYLDIAEFISRLTPRPTVSAYTATATETVKEDIIQKLKLQNPFVLVTGFDRPNLHFSVYKPQNKNKELLSYLEKHQNESGIVYCSTRKAVEDVCQLLIDNGYKATQYHAGLSDKERKTNQESFSEDTSPIIVATNAFGMGIDKSNVRFVVHYNMPKNIESYYQEAGRAGRDGLDSDCCLFFSGQDVRTNLFLIENSKDVEYESPEIEKIVKNGDRERLRLMTLYCNTNDCLRQYILKYFGQKASDHCENCSNCNNEFDSTDITISAQKILSCVARANQRFGVNMIIDILRGSKNKKLLSLRLDKLSTYGIMSSNSESQIKEIVNYLLLNDYLFMTNDQFPVLRLGENASSVLFEGEKLIIKTTKVATESKKEEKTSLKQISLAKTNIDMELFNKLKSLRLELASLQKVPAFVIFADTTLIDLCQIRPKTLEEMLKVRGIGKAKQNQYGQKFLDIILSHNNSN